KRRVALQEQRQVQLEEKFQVAMTQSTNVTNQIVPVLVDRETLREASRHVDEAEGKDADEDDEDEDEPQAGREVPGQAGEADDVLAAQLSRELIRQWERLSEAVKRAQSLDMRLQAQNLSAIGPSFSAPESAYELVRWWRVFRRELEYVEAARNAVAHA